MNAMKFDVIPPPPALQDDVACIRVMEHSGEDDFSINVCLNGLPGIVFQHSNGRSPVESITTTSRYRSDIPTLYVYGQVTEPGIMNHTKRPYTVTQVVLKPHALNSLLGLNASVLTNQLVTLDAFSARDLNNQLMESHSHHQCVSLLTNFLLNRASQAHPRDSLVEEALRLIHKNVDSVKDLLEHVNLSERQFERRFRQVVGISPQFYIRVKRFNRAVRLMHSGQFERLTDVAHALHFHDQSHFIRDVKAFSGVTPKSLSQKVSDFRADQKVIAFM